MLELPCKCGHDLSSESFLPHTKTRPHAIPERPSIEKIICLETALQEIVYKFCSKIRTPNTAFLTVRYFSEGKHVKIVSDHHQHIVEISVVITMPWFKAAVRELKCVLRWREMIDMS